MTPPIMEQIHGIDVSWMTHHGSPKGKENRCPPLGHNKMPFLPGTGSLEVAVEGYADRRSLVV